MVIEDKTFPLVIEDGLPRLPTRPPTDREAGALPHVFLTCNDERWDPSRFDTKDSNDATVWHDALPEAPATPNPGFTDTGDYRHRVAQLSSWHLSHLGTSDPDLDNTIDRCVFLAHCNNDLFPTNAMSGASDRISPLAPVSLRRNWRA